MMSLSLVMMLLVLSLGGQQQKGVVLGSITHVKRLLPNNQNCNPLDTTQSGDGSGCEKGDLIATHIADCDFVRTKAHPVSCTAGGNSTGSIISWVISPDKNNLCQPVKRDVKFVCGSRGSHTRCVCSDYKVEWNKCRCQYWTQDTPGEYKPSFCTTHYLGGVSHVHQYTCCNNCRSLQEQPQGKVAAILSECEGVTYEGGSTGSYCGKCGEPLGGGKLKYYFNCGNCSIQHQCQTLCNSKVPTMAGFCWKWASCFKGCCTSMVSQPRQRHIKKLNQKGPYSTILNTAEGFCGDTICQTHETHLNCPSDCCYKINSKKCPSGAKCSPSCCEQTDCCNL